MVFLGSRSHGTHDHIFVSRLCRSVELLLASATTVIPGFSLLEIRDQDFCSLLQMHVFRNEESSLTRGGVSLSHNSVSHWFSLYSLGMSHTENTVSSSSSVVAHVSVSMGKCLLSHCLATAVSSGSTITIFSHVTLFYILAVTVSFNKKLIVDTF
jgi:hypothetical protein